MTHHPWYFLPTEVRILHLTELATSALVEWGGAEQGPELFLEGENAVFRADLPGHGTCAVRVHRAAYHTVDHLRSQVEWCRALRRDEVVDTARIIDTLRGEPFVVRTHPEVPDERFVSVLSWEPGRSLLEEGASTLSTFELLGDLIGKVIVHGRRWEGRQEFVGIRWDADTFVGDEPLLGPFWETALLDDDDRHAMRRFRELVRHALMELGEGSDRFGIVHGDLLAQNLLLNDGRITLLDFDDCGHGWYLMEIATALMAASSRPDYVECRDALLAGYRRHLDIGDDELGLLPMMIALRTATYVGWVETHPFTSAAIHRGPAITRNGVRAVRRYLGGDGLPV
ncbi:MAG: hypothetical protein E6Q93_08510 [Burkholderiaceae bacterium]|jgi:Ser/Thr protein kinase RdoA (MazF antagonist)|nr:MAG: hypothetical protein E6Q93_08510 [Burkholderiaceae bacterium]